MKSISHKDIGFIYGIVGYIGGILGYLISMYIRISINTQGLSMVRKVKEVTIYNNWITIHGLIMLFVFIMPLAIGLFGNYLVPMLIGNSELSISDTSIIMVKKKETFNFPNNVILNMKYIKGFLQYPSNVIKIQIEDDCVGVYIIFLDSGKRVDFINLEQFFRYVVENPDYFTTSLCLFVDLSYYSEIISKNIIYLEDIEFKMFIYIDKNNIWYTEKMTMKFDHYKVTFYPMYKQVR